MTCIRCPQAVRAWGLLMTMAMLLAVCDAGAAGQGDDEIRKLALTQLQSHDADARLNACTVLADVGRQEDLPLLQPRLFDDDARVRGTAEAVIWAIWSRSGDAATDQLFQRGVQQMRDGHLKGAVETFNRVIAMRPEFAEGWNKRATVYFMLGEDDLSLQDCAQVLERNPRHFGVLAGYGQIYLRKGELQRSLEYFEQALAINPNMTGVQASIDALRELIVKRGRRYI